MTEPSATDEGVQEIAVEVARGFTVRVDERPELVSSVELPPYAPSTTTVPASLPVTVTEHTPDESVHVAGEGNVTPPVPEPCENVTVPVGLPPVTVALHDDVEPTAKELGEHVTVVEVTVREVQSPSCIQVQ